MDRFAGEHIDQPLTWSVGVEQCFSVALLVGDFAPNLCVLHEEQFRWIQFGEARQQHIVLVLFVLLIGEVGLLEAAEVADVLCVYAIERGKEQVRGLGRRASWQRLCQCDPSNLHCTRNVSI